MTKEINILKELKTKWHDVIKADIAFKALAHVINRTILFNSGRFPVAIDSIGIGGSALSSKEIGDIDIVVYCFPKEKFINDWSRFDKLLSKKFSELWSLIVKSSMFVNRVTIDLIINMYRDEIVSLGFKDWWIDEWFGWLRISDFRWGIDRGLPIVDFSIRKLIKRFIKHGWRGKRLEIHVIPSKEDERLRITALAEIPCIMVWHKREGIMNPRKTEIKEFFSKELGELMKLASGIVKGKWFELPPVYWDVSRALKREFSIPEYLPQNDYVILCLNETRKIYEKAKELLNRKLEEIKEYTEQQPKGKLKETIKFNRNLKVIIKEILVLSYIINTITDNNVLFKLITWTSVETVENYLKELQKYIIRNGGRQGYRRAILKRIFQTLTSP